MPSVIVDKLHLTYQFARAGVLKPSRPDRTLRAALALHHWGPTLAAGYVGAAARYPDTPAVIDELGSITFAELDGATNAIGRGLAGLRRARGRPGGDHAAATTVGSWRRRSHARSSGCTASS